MNTAKTLLPVVLALLAGCADPAVNQLSPQTGKQSSCVEMVSAGVTNRPSMQELMDGYDWSLDGAKLRKYGEETPRVRKTSGVDSWCWWGLTELTLEAIRR